MSDTEQNIFLARIAEQVLMYDDMVDYLEQVIRVKSDTMSSSERNLIQTAFKNLIREKRNAMRKVLKMELNPKFYEYSLPLSKYRILLKDMLQSDCTRIIKLITKEVLPRHLDAPAQCFFNKLAADFFRYIAEFAEDADHELAVTEAVTYYEKAVKNKEVGGGSPVKLGAVLNYSVFCFEMLKDHKKAVDVSLDGLDHGLEEINDLSNNDF